MQRMVQPLKMAVLLLSVHPLPDQGLLHIHPMHMTDLPTYLPQAPANDCSSFRSELSTMLIKGAVRGTPLCWFPLVTSEPT